MYELVIVWSDDSKDIYEYGDRETAEKAQAGMKMAFGNQIKWSGVRRKVGNRLNREAYID